MSEAPADFTCEYLERKGDPRPHRGYYYCNQRAITVEPGKSRCSLDECTTLQLAAASAVPGSAGILPAPAAPAAPAVPKDGPAISRPAVPADPQPAAVGGATGPDISPPKEPLPMPARRTRTEIAWDQPAHLTIKDLDPTEMTLRCYCRTMLDAHGEERGFASKLARSIDPKLQVARLKASAAHLPAAKQPKAAQPTPAPTPEPEPTPAPSPVVVGGATGPDAEAVSDDLTDDTRFRLSEAFVLELSVTRAPAPSALEQAADTIAQLGPVALANFIDAYDLHDQFEGFTNGWLRCRQAQVVEAAS